LYGSRPPAFRSWLYKILRFKVFEYLRKERDSCRAAGGTDARAFLEQVKAPDAPSDGKNGRSDERSGEEDEDNVRSILCRRAFEMAKADFKPKTWQAASLSIIEGRPAAEIASELGMTPGGVHTARCRVLKRVREILAQFGERVGDEPGPENNPVG